MLLLMLSHLPGGLPRIEGVVPSDLLPPIRSPGYTLGELGQSFRDDDDCTTHPAPTMDDRAVLRPNPTGALAHVR